MEVNEVVAKLEEIRETMEIQRDAQAVEWLNESIRIIEEQAECIAIMAKGTPDGFPVAEIEKGHMRLAHKEESDGIIVCFCVAEEYGEPGTVANDKRQPVPVFGLKLWGTKNARLIAEGLIAIADDVDERRSNERS